MSKIKYVLNYLLFKNFKSHNYKNDTPVSILRQVGNKTNSRNFPIDTGKIQNVIVF